MTNSDSFERVTQLLQERGTPVSKVGLVIVDHGSKQELSNQLLIEVVSLFQNSYPYPIVEPAHMELAEPCISAAFANCKEQGAEVVIVCPFFLLPGRHWKFDIPDLSATAAQEHQVEFVVTRPLGPHQMLADILQARIVEELNRSAS